MRKMTLKYCKRKLQGILFFAKRNYPYLVLNVETGRDVEVRAYYDYYKKHGGKYTLKQILEGK